MTVRLLGETTHYRPDYNAPILYPSGFAPPAVPGGMTLALFDDFLGSATNPAVWYPPFNGINGEGAIWLGSHQVVANSVLSLQGYQDPTGVATAIAAGADFTDAQASAILYWCESETQTVGPLAQLPVGTRVLTAMRSDTLAGLTAIALMFGHANWPPEIDFVEANAPMTAFQATIHYTASNTQEDVTTTGEGLTFNLNNWAIWGVQWTATTIDFLVQLTPNGSLVVWGSIPNPDNNVSDPNSLVQPMFLSLQFQTNDSFGSTPAFPPNSPDITAANPIQQQHDWVQICVPS